MLPINKDTKDPFYRYKMQPLVVRKEGKQGNPKSIITNFLIVCDSLKRKPELIKQYFMYQLSVQIKLNDRLTLNGEFTPDLLQSTLYNFIDFLVICKNCDNPETKIKIKNNDEESLHLECYACGKDSTINSNHKIISYILKNKESIEYDCYSNELTSNNENEKLKENEINFENLKNENTFSKLSNQTDKNIFIENTLKKILKNKEYDKISLFDPIFAENEGKENNLIIFFSAFEEMLVQNNLFNDFEQIINEMIKFLKVRDFAYFRSKSKKVNKKESVRIRNMLSNYVRFKEE